MELMAFGSASVPVGTDAMTDERVALAWQHHCEGAYPEAESLCREILRDDPENVGAWRLLGEACLFQCMYQDAVEAYRQARYLRTARVQLTARAMGAFFHLDGVNAQLRNAMMAARLPTDYAPLDWLYGHQA